MGPSIRTLNLVNVHGPNKNADRFFADLGIVVGGVTDSRTLLVAGDFNSHLSCSNLSPEESQLIGKFAGHAEFNENGTQMRIFLSLNRLAVRSTQTNSNHGFRWTWTNERLRSQVDHFLTHLQSGFYLRRLRAFLPSTFSTDHKLLLCSLVETHSSPPSPLSRTARYGSNKKKCLEPALLKVPEIQKKFHEHLSSKAAVLDPHSSVDQNWEKFRDKVQSSAAAVLSKSSSMPPDRSCRRAFAEVKKYLFWANRSSHPKWKHRLVEAKEELQRKIREYEEKQIQDFFENLHQFPTGERINRTFRFLKRYKKKKSYRTPPSTIRLCDWVADGGCSSLVPDLLPEPDDSVLPDPPTLLEVQEIVSRMKNGKTPGADSLNAEFFRYCDERTISELHGFLVRVWTENVLPAEWKHVLVVPIPKVRTPKTVDDYRRICLSCTAYKVYAICILNRLQRTIPPIGLHQAAFLPGRSTTDHLYVLQRILQERWNGGQSTLLMSLDIEKAFDRVSLEALPSILRGKFFFDSLL